MPTLFHKLPHGFTRLSDTLFGLAAGALLMYGLVAYHVLSVENAGSKVWVPFVLLLIQAIAGSLDVVAYRRLRQQHAQKEC